MFDGIDLQMNESNKVWRWLYKKMLWFKSDENYIKIKINALTLLLPMAFNEINVKMNKSDEVWRWVNNEYVMIPIIKILYSIAKYNCSELAVTNYVKLNPQNIACRWCSMEVSASKTKTIRIIRQLYSVKRTNALN